jgi:hypothetical protein
MPFEKYITELERPSAQTGVTRLVVCSDTYEAVDAVKACAKRFEVLWDADEEREHDRTTAFAAGVDVNLEHPL